MQAPTAQINNLYRVASNEVESDSSESADQGEKENHKRGRKVPMTAQSCMPSHELALAIT